MNWTQFLLLVTGIYFFYYGVNIAVDFLKTNKTADADADIEQLVFDDFAEPQLITYEEQPEAPVPAAPATAAPVAAALPLVELECSGGLSLKELIRAAQENLIDFTGAIPY